jgi:hypothetical protein
MAPRYPHRSGRGGALPCAVDSLAWLRLAEPFDHAARSAGLVEDLRAVLPAERPIGLVDLGAGTGSNLRYLAPRLGGEQEWHLFDRRQRMLDELPDELGRWAAERALPAHRSGDVLYVGPWQVRWSALGATLPDVGAHAIVANGFLASLDQDAIQDLADWLVDRGVPFLASANLDQRVRIVPGHALDDAVLVSARPDPVEMLAGLLDGFDVRVESTDWRIGADQPDLQRASIARIGGDAAWRAARLEQIDRGRLEIVLGHQELLARPRARGWLG